MIRSRVLTNLAMLAVVVALGILVYRYDSGDPENLLSELDKDLVIQLEIRHRDRYVVLKKINREWQMVRPVNIAANDFRIDSLLNFVNTTSNARYGVDKVDLARFGLDEPRTSIRFITETTETLFEFGAANPINRMRYVRAGDTMHLIDDNLYPLVSSQIGALIDMRLFPGEITVTALQLPDRHMAAADGDWQVTPAEPPLDDDDIDELVDNWRSAQAFGVHDYLEREHLGEVSIDYTEQGRAGSTLFVVSDIDPWLILARPELGIEYHLDISLYDRLFKPGNERDSVILDAEESMLAE